MSKKKKIILTVLLLMSCILSVCAPPLIYHEPYSTLNVPTIVMVFLTTAYGIYFFWVRNNNKH